MCPQSKVCSTISQSQMTLKISLFKGEHPFGAEKFVTYTNSSACASSRVVPFGLGANFDAYGLDRTRVWGGRIIF